MSQLEFQACVFDAYGTLFDVHSAVGRFRSVLADRADRVSALWRQKQLEYTWLRSLMRRHEDFWQITADALDYALAFHQIEDPALRDGLLQAYLELEAYPEVVPTLQALRQKGMKLALLSNGSPAMLQAAVASAGLIALLDEVISVEEVGIFKPDPQVYQLGVDRLGCAAGQILFHSSNAWDVAGATNFGYKVAWINRFGQPPEPLSAPPFAELARLDEVLALL